MEMLGISPSGVYVDGTLGGGGHSRLILERLGPQGRLIGIDRDPEAIEAATARLQDPRFQAVRGNFHDVGRILDELQIPRIDGMLLDLGVSSHQLDAGSRGFSYHQDAPLDMRMDPDSPLSAALICNTWTPEEIERILLEYGEERWARRIAQVMVQRRPLATTGDLVACVDAAIPRAVRDKDSGHSARRTFQALRIAVNDELTPLAGVLFEIVSRLSPGGRLAVITFHSLEDRIVKQTLRALEHPCICPPRAPVCVCHRQSVVRVLKNRKPSMEEISVNPRSRSAMLRGCERTENPLTFDVTSVTR